MQLTADDFMKPTSGKIKEALVDVRKAYRLLHDYQRAALDTVKYVATQLGFEYWDGGPNFSWTAPRGSSSQLFDRWAWDWLNLVFYDFTFSRGTSKESSVFLSIWLISDTGYFMSEDANGRKTDVDRFAPPEKSATVVAFIFFRDWPGNFHDDRAAVRTLLETRGKLPKRLEDSEVWAQCYDFAEMADAESADAVIGKLEAFAKSKDFPVERTPKPIE